MEKLIAIRDAALWWMGCWLACNLVTGALIQVDAWLNRRRMQRAAKRLLQRRQPVLHAVVSEPPAPESIPVEANQPENEGGEQPLEEANPDGAKT